MRRFLPLLIVLALCAVLAVWLGGGESGPATARMPPPIHQLQRAIAASAPDAPPRIPDAIREQYSPGYTEYLEGLIRFRRGDDVEALALLEIAGREVRDDPAVLDAHFAALLANGETTRAGGLADRFLERHPGHPRALWLGVVVRTRVDAPTTDPAGALRLLDRLAPLVEDQSRAEPDDRIDPASIEEARARALSGLGRHDDGLASIRRAVGMQPQRKSLHETHGDLAKEAWKASGDNRRLTEAIEAYSRALQLPPPRRRTALVLVDLMLEDPGWNEPALQLTAGLLEGAPADRELRKLRARALGRTNAPEGMGAAHDLWRGLHAEDPGDLETLRNFGVFLYDWKQGGQEGDYLVEAHRLLRSYLKLGGELDEPGLVSAWEELERVVAEREN